MKRSTSTLLCLPRLPAGPVLQDLSEQLSGVRLLARGVVGGTKVERGEPDVDREGKDLLDAAGDDKQPARLYGEPLMIWI